MSLVQERVGVGAAAWVPRVLLFAIVLVGGAMGVQYRMADYTSSTRLSEDLREHRVQAIDYKYRVDGERYDLDVRWSTGPLSWWQFNESGGMQVPQMIQDAFPESYKTPLQGRTFERDLRAAIGDQDIDVRGGSDLPERFSDRPASWFLDPAVRFGWTAALLAVSVLAVFGVMLTSRDHRYANRWAWTWLFLAAPLGVLAYLCLERRPFPPPRPARTRPPVGGLTGFLLAIPAAFLFNLTIGGLVYLLI